jgi:glycosyltransferase involved in cell wall biosynthesis
VQARVLTTRAAANPTLAIFEQNMSPNRISVAMCTYNGSRFLSEQLQSIALQGRLPDELVICDDGSTDDTVSLLRAFADLTPFPVRIFCNEDRLGPGKNFEKAISLCEGDIIVFSDQDDIWRPEKLARLAEAFDQYPDAVYAFSDADMIAEDGEPLEHTIWDAVGLGRNLSHFSGLGQLSLLLKHNLIAGASMAFRASFREVVLPIPSGWMHDYWIVLLGSALSHGVPVHQRLFMYRRHGSQACGWRKKSFRQVVSESIATGQEVPFKKVEQFREIERRLDVVRARMRCPGDRLELLRQKETHLLKRAAVRSARGASRAIGVLAEASTGRYQRFSNSWLSIVRDLR